MGFVGDIIKEPTNGGRRYSQGRIYLLISFVSFIILNGVLGYCAVAGIPLEDMETLMLVSSNLKWALGSFSLYTLGTKGVGAFRDRDVGISTSFDHERPDHHSHNPYGGGWGNHSSYDEDEFTEYSGDDSEED